MISALKYIHSVNITHNDIKPENVLLTSNGECVLADFAYATQNPPSAFAFLKGGSDAYLLPEYHQGKAFQVQQGDFFALGATLFVLLFGTNPFGKSTVNDKKYNKLFI